MATSKSLLDFVPDSFRSEGDSALLTNIALMNIINEGVDIDRQVGFLSGLKKHLEFVSDETKKMSKEGPSEGWRWYSDTISEVEVIDRKSREGGKLIGRKAQIKFASNETIDTDWIEFSFGINEYEMYWDMALARTIQKVAEDNIGRKVSVLKKVWHDGGTKGGRRMCINIKPSGSVDDAEPQFTPVTIKGASKVAKELKIDFEEIEPDVVDLVKAINDGTHDYEGVLEFVRKILKDPRIKTNKADEEAYEAFEEMGESVQLLAYGISLIDGNLD